MMVISTVPVVDIWVNRVQVIDHLLSGIGKASDLRHCVVAVEELPATTEFAFPPLGGDDNARHFCLLLSLASRACRVNAGDTSRVCVITTVIPSFDQTS